MKISSVERVLTPEAQKDRDEFDAFSDDGGYVGGCSCHINPPCGWCTHPGNPLNQVDDECWVYVGGDVGAARADFERTYQNGEDCRCWEGHSPCDWCAHPGNPANQEGGEHHHYLNDANSVEPIGCAPLLAIAALIVALFVILAISALGDSDIEPARSGYADCIESETCQIG